MEKNFDKEMVMNHMNEKHTSSVTDITKKYSEYKGNITKAEISDIDSFGMDILVNLTEKARVPFPHELKESDIIQMIMTMAQNSKQGLIEKEILDEVEQYLSEFKSVVLGTISSVGKVDVTYAPYLKMDGEHYIFISEIGDHYSNLKNGSKNFEILFLQDESKAASPIVRKRARFNCTAEFQPRDEKFNEILDGFEKFVGKEIKAIRNMQDFHLVKLSFIDGRFVKGFGQAFLLKDGKVSHMTGDKKSHR